MANILFAGDFCPSARVSHLIDNEKYGFVQKEICDIITESDYAVVNFETTIADQNVDTPIKKCGEPLCTSVNALDALVFMGFNCCTLANNHFNDYGLAGVNKSLTALEDRKLDYLGAGVNLESARKILYKNIDNKIIALINCCEHEFSIADKNKQGCNPLDPIQIYYSIIEAKRNADYIFVVVHGGLEYIQVPQIRMKKLYRYFIDLGADAVINHHQHCYCGIERYNGKPIFYGLGNFCFDLDEMRNSNWNEGFLVRIYINDNLPYDIIPYIQCNDLAIVRLLDEAETLLFNQNLHHLSDVLSNNYVLNKMNEDFYRDKYGTYKWMFEPYVGRVLRGLYRRRLLPSFSQVKRELRLNCIECESHREALIHFLKN